MAVAHVPVSRLSDALGNANFHKSASPAPSVQVRDLTALLQVAITVQDVGYDASRMERPEYLISSNVTFTCRQRGSEQLESSWAVYRSFEEFMALDAQLRQHYPTLMTAIPPPKQHRSRALFGLHRQKRFLDRRRAELNEYLAQLQAHTSLRLSRFIDPRAPLVLRWFCDFDAGFGRNLRVRRNQFAGCVLSLDHLRDTKSESFLRSGSMSLLDEERESPDFFPRSRIRGRRWSTGAMSSMDMDAESEVQYRQSDLQQHEQKRDAYRSERQVSDCEFDELEANLMDDRERDMGICCKYACACHRSPFRIAYNRMGRILQLQGYKEVYAPPLESSSALYCILCELQRYNDLDQRLFEAMHSRDDSMSSRPSEDEAVLHRRRSSTISKSGQLQQPNEEQIEKGALLLRQAVANYGLLYAEEIRRHFDMTLIELKKKLHAFRNERRPRVGRLELAILSTMLDTSMTLVTNDHDGSIQTLEPLEHLEPIRRGGRIHMLLAYVLPTVYYVHGYYMLLGTSSESETEDEDDIRPERLWLGLEEMDRVFLSCIDSVMRTDLSALNAFDDDAAEALNRAILEAVWDDCQHNPNLFHLFQLQARQFGKSRTSATFFVQYLEVAFGISGAMYLVDFLLHVLPEEELRKQLYRARWFRLRRHVVKRLAV